MSFWGSLYLDPYAQLHLLVLLWNADWNLAFLRSTRLPETCGRRSLVYAMPASAHLDIDLVEFCLTSGPLGYRLQVHQNRCNLGTMFPW
jgi:hypothetical protein